jgi:ABC-type branched-subunit amino acid transport system substrate-binding protein
MSRRCLTCLLFALLAVGCGGDQVPTGAGRDRLLLGSLAKLDGDAAQAVGMINGVEMAIREYNENPDSRYQIQLERRNTRGTPEGTDAASQDLARTERLVGVVGPFTDDEVEVAAPILERAGIPFLVPTVSTDSVPSSERGVFRRLVPSDRQEGQALAALIAGQVSGGIGIFRQEGDRGESFGAGAKQAIEALKRPVSRSEVIRSRQNFGALANSVIQAPPDAVLYGGAGDVGKALFDALRQAGYRGLFIASHELREVQRQGLGPGVIGSSLAADPSDSAVRAFASEYRRRFGTAPVPFALEAYEGAVMILEAVEEVEGNPSAVAQFLRLNRSFLGDSKMYEYDPSGSGELVNPPVWIYESVGGGWRLTGRSDRLQRRAPPRG